jgi:homoserine kinase
LGIYLSLEAERTAGEEIKWEADWEIDPEENMIAIAFERACRDLGVSARGLRIKVDNQIPLKRGLGSSAAAIVGGIKIAERLAGTRLSSDHVFELAYPLEGHPDNLSASLLGGWVISRVSDGRMQAEKLASALRCQFVLAVPDVFVSTQVARDILPEQLSLADAVFNLQRCALLVHTVCSGASHLLGEATRDRLHQAQRASLVPGVSALLQRKGLPSNLASSLLSVSVSGSGSTILAITDGSSQGIGNWMVSGFANEGISARQMVLELDETGARFV